MRTTFFALAVAAIVAFASPAAAQAPRLLVTAGDLFDVEGTAGADIVEESAWIADDFGGFEILRAYELETVVPADVAAQTRACGAALDCYIGALFGRSIDYALVVSTVLDGTTLVVHYELLDVQVGIRLSDEYAFLSSPTDFASLVGPCETALRRTPSTSIVAPAVDPVPTAPPSVAYVPPTTSTPRNGPSTIRRAGRITASAGGAMLFGGILAGFSADEVQQQIQAEPHERDELERLQSRGQSRQRLANATMAIGAVAIATGVTLVVVDAVGGDSGDTARLEISPTAGGGRVRLSF